MFATWQQLQDLTSRTRPSAVRRQLERMRVRYLLDADGRPKVASAELERHLVHPLPTREQCTPDAQALANLYR